ncbi:hypothetical protein RB653_003233 [Dictyostelium firmibasis]|uniref:EGF-like domain-containing protein n=1 Tax=Dictyostelium firmibasis TaxID=79012 RepID=A0AAN7TY05_9MYCE
MNNLKIIVLLFMLFNVFSIINCQTLTLTDISVGSKDLSPLQSDDSFCSFQMDIQIVSTYEPLYIISPIYSNDLFLYNIFSSPLSNSTCKVYSFQTFLIPIGTHTYTIYSNLTYWDGYEFYQKYIGSLQTTFTCNKIDTSLLQFDFIPSIRSFNPFTINMGVLKINGLNNSCVISTNYGYLFDKGSNNYYILNFQTPFLVATNPLNLTIWFSDKTFYIMIPSIYKSFTGSLSSFTLYPNQINITRFGYNQFPLYSLTVNSNDYPLIFFDKYQRSPPVISYGSKGNYTLIGILPVSGGIDIGSIYAQQGNNINLIYNVTTNTKSFLVNSIPSSGNVSDFILIGKSKIFSVSFKGYQSYDLNQYEISFQSPSFISQWPFGFTGGSNKNFTFSASFILQQNSTNFDSAVFSINPINGYSSQLTATIPLYVPDNQYSNASVLKDFEIFHLYDFNYLLRLSVLNSNNNGLLSITINDKIYRYDKLASGDIINSVFEIIWDYKQYINSISITSGLNNVKIFQNNDFFSLLPNKRIIFPTFKAYDSKSITDISFLYNNVNITNKSVSNIMYFKIVGYDSQNPPIVSLQLLDPVSTYIFSMDQVGKYFSKWNKVMGMLQIEFIIPANTLSGVIPYVISFNQYYSIDNSLLSNSSQLFVNSNYLDSYGPIFSEFKNKTVNSTTFGWEFYIEDPINGFDHGEIIVRGDLDSSTYRFNLSLSNLISGDRFRGKYAILINLKTNVCASQNYLITDVNLFDTQLNRAIYSRLGGYKYDSPKTPFINYLDNPNIVFYNLQQCDNFLDETPPILTSFNMINSLNSNQTLIFNFEAQDIESGLKYDQYPIVYATSYHIEVIECISKIISINSTNAKYRCEMKVPFGFACNNDVIFTVYGFINNGGYYSGFTYDQLINKGFNYSFTSMKIYWNLEITNTSSIKSNGGDLWIMGRGFSNINYIFVNYSDTSLTPDSLTPISGSLFDSVFLISSIKATNKPFTIQIIPSRGGYNSNIYIVNPDVYVYDYVDPNKPPPTNPPQKCIGSPVCGGLDHGYCNGLQGCVCYPPWIGLGCTSMVVVIPPPKLNSSNPSSELPVLGNGETNSNSSNILFKSLVSLVSLRELSFQGDVVNEFKFEKWIYSEINSNQHQYFTNITVPSTTTSPLNSTTTNILVNIQWFPNQTTIKFANQQLTMNPSTVKYTIEIGGYNFKSKLNNLQLVLSASIDSSKTKDVCSNSEFGDTNSGDNSNYVKIQVDDHSLYGRFIKRAIIDSQTTSIENQQLDQYMNPLKSSSSSQSFIGITIPFYRYSATLDPDFSVLVDDKSLSGENSICSNSSSSLTNGQLAGIIVGVTVFTSICIVAIIILIKKRRHLLLLMRAKDIVLAVKKPNY